MWTAKESGSKHKLGSIGESEFLQLGKKAHEAAFRYDFGFCASKFEQVHLF